MDGSFRPKGEDMDKVVHFEIPVDDRERAIEFYRSVFDWDLVHIPEMQYTTVGTVPIDENQRPTEPGAINGGLMERSDRTPSPVITIDVAEIDDALKKVEAGGGSVVTPKTPIPGMGAFAYFKDPEGNTMGLFQSH
jgi:predicted enzyme related to lactoylglutathione lyase